MGRPAAELSWDFSCVDWADRLRDGRSLVPDLPLDEKLVAKAVGIFDKLRLPDVAGNPLLADAAGDWWRDIIAAIFGSVDDLLVRHVREVLCEVPKKNSKTTNAAATAITAVLMDESPRQRYSLYGPTQEISDRGFAQAVGMIGADPEGYLQQRFHVRHHLKMIVDRKTETTLKVSTFDEKVATGGIEKGVIIDELHILGKNPAASRVLGQIRGGMLPRDDAFMLMITTQSDTPPSGVFRAELMLARAIRDGRVRGEAARMLPVLYEFPEAMQTDQEKPWANPDNWPMVLPNLGRSISIKSLHADWEAAKEKGEEEIRRWASQHLNVEIGLALHSDRWRGADYWEQCGDETLRDLDGFLARCEVVIGGVDGGGLDDLAALAFAGRERDTGDWISWAHAWVQPEVLELRKDIATRLREFEADGDLTICNYPTQDIVEIARLLAQAHATGLMPEQGGIGLDPQSIGPLIAEMAEHDLVEPLIVAIGQGYRLSSAVWSCERKLKDKTFRHGGTSMMNWCVGNARAEQRGNAVYITKETAGKAKIDPLVAVFDAVKLLERNPVAAGDRGVSSWLESLRA